MQWGQRAKRLILALSVFSVVLNIYVYVQFKVEDVSLRSLADYLYLWNGKVDTVKIPGLAAKSVVKTCVCMKTQYKYITLVDLR